MRHPNYALAHQLKATGWRPPQLAAAINDLLGPGYISRSTVSEWVHAGRVPREPLPAITAALLAEATGSQVAVDQLWPGVSLAPTWTVPADDGLDRLARQPDPAFAVAEDWIRHCNRRAGCDRRRFHPVPRSTHTAAAAHAEHSWTTPADLTLGAVAQAGARQLSDLPESPASLHFAHRQVIALAETLADDPREASIAAALTHALMSAGQLAHALGKHGLSQRYQASGGIIDSSLGAGSR